MQPDPSFSIIKGALSEVPHNRTLTADKLVVVIQTNEQLKALTQTYRSIPIEHESNTFAERELTFFMPSGVFLSGCSAEHLEQHRGTIWLHFIRLSPVRLSKLESHLWADEYTYIAFSDEAGTGLWAAYRIDYQEPSDQPAFYNQLVHYCQDNYGVTCEELSPNGQDIGQRIPILHTDKVHYHPLSEIIPLLEEYQMQPEYAEVAEEKNSCPPPNQSYTRPKTVFNGLVDSINQTYGKDSFSGNGKLEQHDSTHELADDTQNFGLLKVRSANGWIEEAKSMPIPRMLLDEFWREGEICILFAEANQGKSILGVQAGDSISRGDPIKGLRMEAEPQPVLYFDFELSAKQFEARYSQSFQHHYRWHDNFKRVEINPDADIPEGYSFEEFLNESMELTINQTKAKVLIIDNITYLRTDTETAKDAGPLMKYLKALKHKYGLSLLILAHCPKRDASRPLTRNDLQGSSRLNQFADSMIAIGASAKDSQLKYLKQVKVRSTAYKYDGDNVVVCQIHQPGSFLMFEHMGFSSEHEHLKQMAEKDTVNLTKRILELDQQGKTQVEIAREVGISQPTVGRKIKAAKKAEEVTNK